MLGIVDRVSGDSYDRIFHRIFCLLDPDVKSFRAENASETTMTTTTTTKKAKKKEKKNE